jgi:hypothetical protein
MRSSGLGSGELQLKRSTCLPGSPPVGAQGLVGLNGAAAGGQHLRTQSTTTTAAQLLTTFSNI